MIEDMDFNFGSGEVSDEALRLSEIADGMFYQNGEIGYKNFSSILAAPEQEFNEYLSAMGEAETSYEDDSYIISSEDSEERVQ